jgi:hypothetical protein
MMENMLRDMRVCCCVGRVEVMFSEVMVSEVSGVKDAAQQATALYLCNGPE